MYMSVYACILSMWSLLLMYMIVSVRIVGICMYCMYMNIYHICMYCMYLNVCMYMSVLYVYVCICKYM